MLFDPNVKTERRDLFDREKELGVKFISFVFI